MGRGPSIIDRLMRRGRKEEDTSDEPAKKGSGDDTTRGQDAPPPDEPSKEPSTDPEGDTDTASGDVLTISEGSGAADDENVSSDDASDTEGDVLTVGDGSTVLDDTDDSNVSTGDAATDDSSGVVTADEGDAVSDDSSGTVTAGEGDTVGADDDDSASIAEGDGEVTTGDGTQTGDVVGGDSNQGTIDDSVQTGDVVTGDGNQEVIDEGDPGTPPQEADSPSRAELGLERAEFGRIGAPQESDLAQELRHIKNATEPQLDPAVIEARLGGRGPQPPEPDDTPDDLAFGKGASPAAGGVAHVEEVDEGIDPVAANPPDVGLDPVGPGLNDAGLDPVGGAPPDDGFGPHDVRIDDPGPHDEPTEVDID